MSRNAVILSILGVLLLTVLVTAGAGAQDLEAAEVLLQQARARYNEIDFPGTIERAGELVDLLEPLRLSASLSAEQRHMLTQAYELRALAYFNLNEEDQAKESFGRLLHIDPAYELTPAYTFPVIEELFAAVREATVGYLTLRTNPAEATLAVDGRELGTAPFEALPLPAGDYELTLSKPGYATATEPVTLTAGETRELSVTLERTTASITLYTSPNGVEVYLDGELVGATSGMAGEADRQMAEENKISLSQISAPFIIPSVPLGKHNIEFRKECHESLKVNLQEIDKATDLILPNLYMLEKSVGRLRLEGVPADARVYLDGEEFERGQNDFGELCAGEYEVRVETPAGRFSRTVTLTHNQVATLSVVLRPALLLAPPSFGERMELPERTSAARRIAEVFGSLDAFEVVTMEGSAGAGIVNTLRSLLPVQDQGPLPEETHRTIRTVCRENNVHLVAGMVYEESRLGRIFRLILFSYQVPYYESIQVNIDDSRSVEQMLSRLRYTPELSDAWLGITAVDTRIHEGTVVIAVQEGSPASAAGVKTGACITALGQTPVDSYRRLRQLLAEQGPGQTVALALDVGDEKVVSEITLGETPVLLPVNNAEVFYGAAIASLDLMAEREQDEQKAMLARLNAALATAHFGAWDEMVTRLRTIELGDGPGINQGTVHYYLGLAYENLGYPAEALNHYTRALDYPSATLESNDGPPLLPRVQHKVQRLKGNS